MTGREVAVLFVVQSEGLALQDASAIAVEREQQQRPLELLLVQDLMIANARRHRAQKHHPFAQELIRQVLIDYIAHQPGEELHALCRVASSFEVEIYS